MLREQAKLFTALQFATDAVLSCPAFVLPYQTPLPLHPFSPGRLRAPRRQSAAEPRALSDRAVPADGVAGHPVLGRGCLFPRALSSVDSAVRLGEGADRLGERDPARAVSRLPVVCPQARPE